MTLTDDYYTVSVDNGPEKFTINKQYKVIRKIGSGSYGSVCSALDVQTNEGTYTRNTSAKQAADDAANTLYLYWQWLPSKSAVMCLIKS